MRCKNCEEMIRADEHGIWRDTFGLRLCLPKNKDHEARKIDDLSKTQPARMVRSDGAVAGGAAAKKQPKG